MGIGPHNEEVKRGENFVGDSGDVLWPVYDQFEIKRDEVFTMNLVSCQPPDNETSKPNPEAVKCCKWYRDKLLKKIKPNVVVALGEAPTVELTGARHITRTHGQVLRSERYNCKVVPALHPAYILRNRHLLPQLVADIEVGIKQSASKKRTKQRRRTKIHMIRKPSQLLDVMKETRATGICAFDWETTGLNWWRDKGVCLSMAPNDEEAFVIAIRENGVRCFSDDDMALISGLLNDIFNQEDVTKMAQRINFDKHFNANIDVRFEDLNYHDPKILQHLLDENAPNGLKAMVRTYTDMGGYEHEIEDEDHKINWARVPPEKLYQYNGDDSVALVKLTPILIKKVKAIDGLWDYYKHRRELTKWIWHSERRGLPVSYLRLLRLRDKTQSELGELTTKLQKETYKSFNPNSSVQLQKVLFEDCKYPVVKKSQKTGLPSTDESVLAELRKEINDPLLNLLSDYREVQKLDSTYIRGWISRLDLDFRLHTTLHPTGARTGRLSSTNPNLQNPPRGGTVRSLVKAPPGWDVACGDLSQAELRVAAVLIGDRVLEKEVRAGRDFHDITAAILFGEAYTRPKSKEQKKEFRALAKTVNFKVLYGGEQFEDDRARQVYEKLLREFPSIKKWQKRCQQYVHKGEMRLPTGRRRRFPPVQTDRELKHQYREATNNGPQSLANEWNCVVFIKLWKYVKEHKMKSYPALMVHDSTVGFSPKEETKEYLRAYKKFAQEPIPFLKDLVIPVETGYGQDWFQAEQNAKK